MEGSINGTSIQDLKRRESSEQYENLRRLHNMQNQHYEAAPNGMQSNQQPYYTIQSGAEYPQYNTQQYNVPMEQNRYSYPVQQTAIEDLARDINNNLSDDQFDEVASELVLEETRNRNWLTHIPKLLQEPLLLLIIYIILSQPLVRDNIGKYIKQINPDETGRVSLMGIIIYGTLLVVLYSVTKMLLR